MVAVSKAIGRQAEEFARLIASEGIKTIREARLEVARCQDTLTLGAEEAKRLTGETVRFDQSGRAPGRTGWWSRRPIGIVVALTPYNDPLNLVAHKVAPAVAAGAPIIVKPHPQTPLSALRLVNLFADRGLPEGMVQIVIGGASVGARLVADHRPAVISLSGSRAAGEDIARIAGLKRLCMELGGVGVATVAADADLNKASAALVSGAFWAAGQNCVHTQRIIVERSVFDPLTHLMVERTRALRVGSKHDDATDIGPMFDERQAACLEALILHSRDAGAEVLTGGKRTGNLFMPTLLTKVPHDHPLLETRFSVRVHPGGRRPARASPRAHGAKRTHDQRFPLHQSAGPHFDVGTLCRRGRRNRERQHRLQDRRHAIRRKWCRRTRPRRCPFCGRSPYRGETGVPCERLKRHTVRAPNLTGEKHDRRLLESRRRPTIFRPARPSKCFFDTSNGRTRSRSKVSSRSLQTKPIRNDRPRSEASYKHSITFTLLTTFFSTTCLVSSARITPEPPLLSEAQERFSDIGQMVRRYIR